ALPQDTTRRPRRHRGGGAPLDATVTKTEVGQRAKWTIAGSRSLGGRIHTRSWRLENSTAPRRSNSSAEAAVILHLGAVPKLRSRRAAPDSRVLEYPTT